MAELFKLCQQTLVFNRWKHCLIYRSPELCCIIIIIIITIITSQLQNDTSECSPIVYKYWAKGGTEALGLSPPLIHNIANDLWLWLVRQLIEVHWPYWKSEKLSMKIKNSSLILAHLGHLWVRCKALVENYAICLVSHIFCSNIIP